MVTIDNDLFDKATEETKNIPNIAEKKNLVVLARGYVMELSTHFELSFNALLSRMGGENPVKGSFKDTVSPMLVGEILFNQ